jgi:hypothetical protein
MKTKRVSKATPIRQEKANASSRHFAALDAAAGRDWRPEGAFLIARAIPFISFVTGGCRP